MYQTISRCWRFNRVNTQGPHSKGAYMLPGEIFHNQSQVMGNALKIREGDVLGSWKKMFSSDLTTEFHKNPHIKGFGGKIFQAKGMADVKDLKQGHEVLEMQEGGWSHNEQQRGMCWMKWG